MLSTGSRYVIPRKVTNRPVDDLPEDYFRFVPVDVTSERFRDGFAPVIVSRLATHKTNVKIAECLNIENPKLERKFEKLREKIAKDGAPSDISYGFMIICDNPQEIDVLAKDGLWTANVSVGDLGIPEKGVYLSESPDLTTPAPFVDESTTLRICAFKILKGRTRTVPLGSYEMEPTEGCNSHTPVAAPEPSSLTRHDLYRYNQIYLFEKLESGRWATRPSNVLPFAIYTIEFQSSSKNVTKKVPATVWKGKLVVRDRIYGGLQLVSPQGISIKPFHIGSRMEIEELIDWKQCIKSSVMVELLAAPLVGELAFKKELTLRTHQRFVSYFTLESEDKSAAFEDFFETLRIHSLAGVVDAGCSSALVLIPNGFLSMLLALPFKHGPVFHCLYISPLSLLYGQFIPMSNAEAIKFDVDPLLGEKVDGIDVGTQKISREMFPSEWLKKALANDDEDSPPPIEQIPRNHPDRTPESHSPVDMEIEKPEEENVQRFQAALSNRPGAVNLSVDMEAVARSIREFAQQIKPQKAVDPRRQRPALLRKDLPLPKLSDKPAEEPATSESPKVPENEEKKEEPTPSSSKDVPEEEEEPLELFVRCHIPYSSPPRGSDDEGPSTSAADVEDDKDVPTVKTSTKPIPDDYIESPASPPPEDDVYIASASKIIPMSDEQSSFDSSLESSSKLYRAPQISLFPDSVKNFQLSDAGVKALQELSKMPSDRGRKEPSLLKSAEKVVGNVPLKADEDERVRFTPATSIPSSHPDAPGRRTPKLEPVFEQGKSDRDSLLRASSKDVDLRIRPSNPPAGSSKFVPLQKRPLEKSAVDLNKGTPVSFASTAQDKDDRILPPSAQTMQRFPPTSIGANEQHFAGKPPGPAYPPPLSSGEKVIKQEPYEAPVASAYPYPPPMIPGQADKLSLPASRACPPPPPPPQVGLQALSVRPLLNQPLASTSNQGFGFFNSAAPPASRLKVEPSSFPPSLPGQEKMFFQQHSFASMSSPLRARFPSPFMRPPPLPPSIQGLSRPGFEPRPPAVKRSVVLPDDHLFFKGPLPAKLLSAILDRFEVLQMSGIEYWWLKLHSHVDEAWKKDVKYGGKPPPFIECRTVLSRYKDRRRIEVMKPHDCDLKSPCTAADYYECLVRTSREKLDVTVIFLSDVVADSEYAKQLELNGIEVWNMKKLLQRLDIKEPV